MNDTEIEAEIEDRLSYILKTMMNKLPHIVELGDGEVGVGCGTLGNGTYGIIFSPLDEVREIGTDLTTDKEDTTRYLGEGDTVLIVKNIASLEVLEKGVAELRKNLENDVS